MRVCQQDQLIDATPVSGGMGMTLLQKMGWKPGEGLGKNKEGTLEPLMLEIKMDKKGNVNFFLIIAHTFNYRKAFIGMFDTANWMKK